MSVSIRPIQKHENDDVYQMFQDIPEEENDATNHANGMNRSDFDEFCKQMDARSIAKANGKKEFSDGKVPQTMYIIFNDEIPVGFGKFRPFLNEACIRNRAGHFAYMISPKHRGKGYATTFLSFIKSEALKLGLNELEGTVLEKNTVSCHIMEKVGGRIKERVESDIVYTIDLNRRH